jgi:hypothetical protein
MRTLCAVAVVLVGLFVQTGSAQSSSSRKTELAGTWLMDVAKSEPKPSYEQLTLTIKYEDPVIRIQSYSRSKQSGIKSESAYYSDGRGEVDSVTERRTITKWKGDSLIISYQVQEFPSKRYFDTIEVWSTSNDGKKLTIKVFSQPAGTDKPSDSVSSSARRIFLRVYRRV